MIAEKVKSGDVLKVKVKSIMDYGVFLTSFVGEGLLHMSNITDLYISSRLDELFKINEECYVCILSIDKDRRIEFGLKQLERTEYSETLKRIENKIMHSDFYIDNNDSVDEIITSKESLEESIKKKYFINGHIFEHFSNLQSNYLDKIEYLQLAKIFYSAIKSERSYFLNIYINYFHLFNEFEEVINSKNIENISLITQAADELYNQLIKNTVSIERFPSTYRLLYFLDIIKNFLEFEKDSFDTLYDYIFNDLYSEYPIIRSISKIVLSNNLISSEKKDEGTIFKNLNVIYNLLQQGIFNLDESEVEKRARIFKEKIKEIKESIRSEESEKVEFKSSLIKPILNDFDIKRYNKLKKVSGKELEIENMIGNKAKCRIIHSAMKTLVAFANSKGGLLLIGVDDDGNILGLGNDYEEIGSNSRDEFRKKFDEFIDNYIGNYFFSLISTEIERIDKVEVLIVNVQPSEEEVFLLKDDKKQKCTDFYIRRQSSSVKLVGKELINYYKTRFRNNIITEKSDFLKLSEGEVKGNN